MDFAFGMTWQSNFFNPRIICAGLFFIVGLDKFFNFAVNWDIYLNQISRFFLPTTPFLFIVGIGEIFLSFYILSGRLLGRTIAIYWLAFVSLNLVIAGFFDIALLDLVILSFILSIDKSAWTKEKVLPYQR